MRKRKARLISQQAIDQAAERLMVFLRAKANAKGRVRTNDASLVWGTHRCFPEERRLTVGEVAEGVQLLLRRRKVKVRGSLIGGEGHRVFTLTEWPVKEQADEQTQSRIENREAGDGHETDTGADGHSHPGL